MDISVVLVSLNEEENVEQCLDSIFSQTRKPDEVILVDANSEDKTVEKAKKYDLDGIFFEDADIGAQRNKGIEEASGDIVVFTDVDGYVAEDWLEEIENAFEEYPHAVGVQGRSVSMSSEMLQEKGEEVEKGRKVVFAHGANTAYNKEVLEKVGGYDTTDNCGWDDMDLSYRVSKHGDIRYWPDSVQYDKNEGSNFKTTVRNGRWWVRFMKKHRKPQWIVRPYYFVLLFLINGEIQRGIEEGVGMTLGMFKEFGNEFKQVVSLRSR